MFLINNFLNLIIAIIVLIISNNKNLSKNCYPQIIVLFY